MKLGYLSLETSLSFTKDPIERLLKHSESLSQKGINGLVLSNQALLGAKAIYYSGFKNLYDWQNEIILEIQKNLAEESFILCGFLNKNKKYKPVMIQKKGLVEGPQFFLESSGESLVLGVASYFEDFSSQQDFFKNSQALIVLEEKRFSFLGEEILSVKEQQKKLEDLFNTYPKSIANPSIIGIQEGHVWDGTMGFYDKSMSYVSVQSFFKETLVEVDYSVHQETILMDIKDKEKQIKSLSLKENLFKTMCEFISSYEKQSGLKKAIIAISGGLDSALVATLAVKALGKDKVFGLLLPGPYSSDHSLIDAKDLCQNLGIEYKEVSIVNLYDTFVKDLKKHRESFSNSLTIENLQARLRADVIMAFANELLGFVLNTGNKSEAAVGYCTLYGDSIGAISPIVDLYKTEVYEMSYWINDFFKEEIIPLSILKKEPSAELSEDQKDSDSLPVYSVLDALLKGLLEEDKSPEEISKELDISRELVEKMHKKVIYSEYKRRQSPLKLNLTPDDKGLNRSFFVTGAYPFLKDN